MSQRPGIQLTIEEASYGGESPNRFVAARSAHIRVYWPPYASEEEIISTLNLAHDEAVTQIKRKCRGTTP